MSDTFDWDSAEPRDRDAWIATQVFGWTHDIWGNIAGWRDSQGEWKGGLSANRFTTDPAADYEVLKRVRETWDRRMTEAFYIELRKILNSKMFGVYRNMSYEPGDWSWAAYRATRKEDNHGHS